jgi:hypothetical protein
MTRPLSARTDGYGLGFPATLFLSTVLHTGSTRFDVWAGGDFHPVPGYTSRNILWSTAKVNEACARPPHVG